MGLSEILLAAMRWTEQGTIPILGVISEMGPVDGIETLFEIADWEWYL